MIKGDATKRRGYLPQYLEMQKTFKPYPYMLDASRIEGGTLNIYKEGINIKDIILDALGLTNGRSSLYDKQSQVKIIYEPHDIFIMAYRDRVTQVISNILNNAVKSTKEKEQEKTERVISVITLRRRDS